MGALDCLDVARMTGVVAVAEGEPDASIM